MLTLRDASGMIPGARVLGDPDARFTSVVTDTRLIEPGCLFVAWRGERFDAHDFLDAAADAGAVAALVQRPTDRLPALLVPDTRRALGEIAAAWRRRFELPVIAVTGSNGKTTVKEMLAAILAARFGEAGRLATAGNLNNDVGLPLTVLRLRPAHRAAVLELGMNRPGEIDGLAAIAAPTVALVNNAQREHQEFMGSVEATAIENGSAIARLPADGVAVFPADDPHADVWRRLSAGRRAIMFGSGDAYSVNAPSDANASRFMLTVDGARIEVRLAIDGRHNVRNALAAAACAHAIGIEPAMIAAGLAAFRPVAGRLVRHALPGGGTLIDDSYNANPDSVRAAIAVLADASPPRILVLGDMGEVGPNGPEFHREVGAYAAASGLDALLGAGEASALAVLAFGAGGQHFDDLQALAAQAAALAHGVGTVLVKGSRFMRMERVVAQLTAPSSEAGQCC